MIFFEDFFGHQDVPAHECRLICGSLVEPQKKTSFPREDEIENFPLQLAHRTPQDVGVG